MKIIITKIIKLLKHTFDWYDFNYCISGGPGIVGRACCSSTDRDGLHTSTLFRPCRPRPGPRRTCRMPRGAWSCPPRRPRGSCPHPQGSIDRWRTGAGRPGSWSQISSLRGKVCPPPSPPWPRKCRPPSLSGGWPKGSVLVEVAEVAAVIVGPAAQVGQGRAGRLGPGTVVRHSRTQQAAWRRWKRSAWWSLPWWAPQRFQIYFLEV